MFRSKNISLELDKHSSIVVVQILMENIVESAAASTLIMNTQRESVEVKRRVFNSLNLPNFNDNFTSREAASTTGKLNYLNSPMISANTIRAISHDSIKSLACHLHYFSCYNTSPFSSSASVNLVKPVALRPKKGSSDSSTSAYRQSCLMNNDSVNPLLFNDKNRHSKFVDRRSMFNNGISQAGKESQRPHLNLIKMKVSHLNQEQQVLLVLAFKFNFMVKQATQFNI